VGTVVQAGAPSTYLGSISEQLLLEQITITEFIEARMFTEKSIVTLCVHRAGPELVQNLAKNIEAQHKALQERQDALFNDLDLRFHKELGEGCGNSVMRKFFQTSADLLSAFAGKSYLVPGNLQLAYQGHVKIYQAIKQRDALQAEEAMVWHIEEIALKTLNFLGLELEYELPQLR
jgi:GntR family transcriptional repressor for pyruvate dehydrogenase complex